MRTDILVLGGTGFIGRPVVERLHRAGRSVAVFHRGHRGGDLPDEVGRILGDRRALADHAEALQGLGARVVVDVIAYTEAEARALVAALGDAVERIVLVSSQDVYRAYDRFRRAEDGPLEPVPYTEEAPLRDTRYPYRGQAPSKDPWIEQYDKILVEEIVRAAPPAGTVLRLPMVHGPGDRQRRTLGYLARMDDERPAILLEEGHAGWRGTRGYVDDVAAGIAAAVLDERAAGRTYNLGEADPATEAAWVRAIGEAAGWEGEVVAVPSDLWPAARARSYDWRQDLVADTGRVRDELGYAEPTPPGEGLERTIAWERDQGRPENAPAPDYAAEDRLLERLGREGGS